MEGCGQEAARRAAPPWTTSTLVAIPFWHPRSHPNRGYSCTGAIVEHSSNTRGAHRHTWSCALTPSSISHRICMRVRASGSYVPRQKLHATTFGPAQVVCRLLLPGMVDARFLCAACCSEAGRMSGRGGAVIAAVGELSGSANVAMWGSSLSLKRQRPSAANGPVGTEGFGRTIGVMDG